MEIFVWCVFFALASFAAASAHSCWKALGLAAYWQVEAEKLQYELNAARKRLKEIADLAGGE